MLIKCSPFRLTARDKRQALKPLEEAAEVFNAWQFYQRHCVAVNMPERPAAGYKHQIVYECADVVQAVVNLLAAYDIGEEEFARAMEECRANNIRRGREYAD